MAKAKKPKKKTVAKTKKKRHPVLTYTCFSQTGIFSLGKLLKEKYGCTVVEQPKFDKKMHMWVIKMIDPTITDDA